MPATIKPVQGHDSQHAPPAGADTPVVPCDGPLFRDARRFGWKRRLRPARTSSVRSVRQADGRSGDDATGCGPVDRNNPDRRATVCAHQHPPSADRHTFLAKPHRVRGVTSKTSAHGHPCGGERGKVETPFTARRTMPRVFRSRLAARAASGRIRGSGGLCPGSRATATAPSVWREPRWRRRVLWRSPGPQTAPAQWKRRLQPEEWAHGGAEFSDRRRRQELRPGRCP